VIAAESVISRKPENPQYHTLAAIRPLITDHCLLIIGYCFHFGSDPTFALSKTTGIIGGKPYDYTNNQIFWFKS